MSEVERIAQLIYQVQYDCVTARNPGITLVSWAEGAEEVRDDYRACARAVLADLKKPKADSKHYWLPQS